MDFFKQATQSLGGSGAQAEILQQAEGFLGSHGGSGQQAPAATKAQAPGAATVDQTPEAAPGAAPVQQSGSGGAGYSQLYGNAQTLYEGLQDKMTGKQSNIDDQQLAQAASNVLEAADNTSFIKDSQYGQYLDKAQSYLQSYGAPKGTAAAAPPSAPSAPLHAPAGRAPAPSADDAPAARAPAPAGRAPAPSTTDVAPPVDDAPTADDGSTYQ